MSQALERFGSSGIRGPFDEVDVTVAMALGRAVGAHFHDLVVGRDARLTGPALEDAFIAGALGTGARVTRVGVVPTPAVAWMARHHELGVQVTASHNPAPDNGFKLWTPAGSAVSHDTLIALEHAMGRPPDWKEWAGAGRLADTQEGLPRYIDAVLSHVGTDVLGGMRIAVDCAHGTGALATPLILSRLGADLRVLGGSPDGRFPDHPSEPSAENLAGLARILEGGGFDLGIAHDGDADRTVFLYPDGTLIDPVRLMTVLADVRGDQKVAMPIDAGGVFRDTHPDKEIVVTPVGDIHLSRAIESGATLACEPSGTWFFADWSPAPEGPAAAAHIAALVHAHPDLLERVAALPPYERRSTKHRYVTLARAEVRTRMSAVAEALQRRLPGGRVSLVDGVRIDTDDGWVLVRPSGTEPIVRITAEARKTARVEALLAMGTQCVRGAFGEAA